MREQATLEYRRVRLRYRGSERIVCPHVLGWKRGRATALLYQVHGMTSEGALPDDPKQRWRSVFVDEVEEAVIVSGDWKSAENFSLRSNCIDTIHVAVASNRDRAAVLPQRGSVVGAGCR